MPHDTAARGPNVEETAKNVRLPPCPSVLTKLLRELREEEPNFVKVAKLIGSDVSLGAAILKTVNSSYYGLRTKVASVHHALNVLGLRNAAQLVTGLLLREAFQTGAHPNMQHYWDSTFKIALLNALLARSLALVDREEAYTFALFRDCGALAMMASVRGYDVTLPGSSVCGQHVVDVENDRHGVNHAAIGYHLTKSWFVPEHLCQAVLHHHEYGALHEGSLAIEPTALKHVALAIAAEWLYVKKLLGGTCPQWANAAAFSLETLGTSEGDLMEIVENLTGL